MLSLVVSCCLSQPGDAQTNSRIDSSNEFHNRNTESAYIIRYHLSCIERFDFQKKMNKLERFVIVTSGARIRRKGDDFYAKGDDPWEISSLVAALQRHALEKIANEMLPIKIYLIFIPVCPLIRVLGGKITKLSAGLLSFQIQEGALHAIIG